MHPSVLKHARTAMPALMLMLASTQFAAADAVEDFYRGKTLRIVIGFDAGGGYDVYARAIAPYLSKYMPGAPNVIVQNMPGAGSRLAANWLYNVAPQDGTAIGTVSQGAPMDQATGQSGVQYKSEKFGWIGNPAVDALVTMTWSAAGYVSLDDVKKKGGLICGGSGGTTPSMTFPRIINAMLDAHIRVIPGYSGSGGYALAMERGELNCIGAVSWSTAKGSMAHLLNARQVNILMLAGPTKQDDIAAYSGRDVPLMVELAKSDRDRQALELITSGVTVGRPLFTPPGVPSERLAALRKAFDATMKDSAFLADAEKRQLNINPISGEELQKAVANVTTAAQDVLKRVDELSSEPGTP